MKEIPVEIECKKITISIVDGNDKPIKNCVANFVIHGSLGFGPWKMGDDGTVTETLCETEIPCHVYVVSKEEGFHAHTELKEGFTEDTIVVFTLIRSCI